MSTKALTLAALMLFSTVAAVPMAGASVASTGTDDRAAELAPGEALASALQAHDTSLRGDLDERAIAVALARAGTDETSAQTLRATIVELEARLDALEQRHATVKERHAAGESSDRRYRVELVRVMAEIERIERMLAVIEARSVTLPAERVDEYRTAPAEIASVRERTARLAGQEDATVARERLAQIQSTADRDAAIEGRLTTAATILERAELRVERAHEHVGDDETARRYLSRADGELAAGSDTLDRARQAYSNEDHDAAIRLITVSITHARTAEALAARALAVADDTDSDEGAADRAVRQAADSLADAEAVVERAEGYRGVGDNPDAQPSLARARQALADGDAAVTAARRALAAGEYQQAVRHATSAISAAGDAEAFAERAMQIGGVSDGPDAGDRALTAIDRAAERIDAAASAIDRAEAVVEGDRDAVQILERASVEYRSAEAARTEARSAYESGEYRSAYRQAMVAIDHAESAIMYAERAIEMAAPADRPGNDAGGDDDGAVRDDPDGTEIDTADRTGATIDHDRDTQR